jgi:hypothetical protein
MRRIGMIATAALVLLTLSVGSVAAKPATSFTARANHGEQGGQMQVQAKVKHAARGATFTATAVVHFASGDVAVELTRHGRSFVAAAKVPVAADEALGPVAVDVTITYNGAPMPATATGTVVTADEDTDTGDDGDTDD